jgi:hypothetical protein
VKRSCVEDARLLAWGEALPYALGVAVQPVLIVLGLAIGAVFLSDGLRSLG